MKDRKPNVLLLIPNLGKGGAQRVFYQHREFLSKDFNVTLCVFNFDGAFEEDTKENILSLNVPGGRNIVEKISCFRKRVQKLKEIKREHKIDLTISHLEGADYVNVLSRQKDKLILWIHGTKLHDKEIKGVVGWLRKAIMLPWLYRRADKIVCVSQLIEVELKSMIPSASQKISTVRNGINVQQVQAKSMEPLPQEWQSLLSKYFVIVTHCRFAPQKNLRALIRLISKLDDMDHVKFVLIGDGQQRNELIELSKTLNISLEEKIFFTGQQKNPFAWLRHSSLYILTSLWEGFPLALCEAIVCGLPVMAADCPTGPKEILGAVPAGVLMPLIREDSPSSIDRWATELRNIIGNPNVLQAYRQQATEGAYQFSDDRTKAETISVVKNILA
jgi:glycosyltransferase involved in cell wall biosynthesis